MDFDSFARDFVQTHKYDPDQPRDRKGRWADTGADFVDPFDGPQAAKAVPKSEPVTDGTARGDIRVAAKRGGWSVQPGWADNETSRESYKNFASMADVDVDYDADGGLKSARWGQTASNGRREATTTDPKVVADWLKNRSTPHDAATESGRQRKANAAKSADLMDRSKMAEELSSKLDRELPKSLGSLEVSHVSPFSDPDGTFGFTGGLHDPDFTPGDNAEGRPDAAQFMVRVRPDGVGEVDTLWDSDQERVDPAADNELAQALRRLALGLGAERVSRTELLQF